MAVVVCVPLIGLVELSSVKTQERFLTPFGMTKLTSFR
jgi:hypothetical protein